MRQGVVVENLTPPRFCNLSPNSRPYAPNLPPPLPCPPTPGTVSPHLERGDKSAGGGVHVDAHLEGLGCRGGLHCMVDSVEASFTELYKSI